MESVEKILEEREKNYGSFGTHAVFSQALKNVMRSHSKWKELYSYQQEALEMVQHKIARIQNGDADYADSWVDIAGYATLVVKKLESVKEDGD